MDYQTILNHVVFEFIDEVHNGQFAEEMIGSIMLANKGKDFQNDASLSRIALVLDVGPKCTFVKAGDKVIVEKQCWTPGFKPFQESKEIWRTEEKHILAIVDDED